MHRRAAAPPARVPLPVAARRAGAMRAEIRHRRARTNLRLEGWQILKATWRDSGTNNLSLIAAGTAFWGFAAIAPMLAATVLTYGIISTPATLANNIHGLFGVLPRDAAALIADQLA